MINEEARERLDIIITKHEIDDENVTITNERDYEAMRVAIKALEQQTCEDAISREALLEDLYKRDYTKFTHRDFVALVQYQDTVQPKHGDVISRNLITQTLNKMDRYVAEELTLCDTDKKFPKNEVFIVDDVYEQIVEQLPSVNPQPKTGWIPVSEKLPEDIKPVIVTWKNIDPKSYYQYIVGKHFIGTAHYKGGKWFWYSSVTEDLLAEYGRCDSEEFDEAIEVIAWMPLPQPYEPQESEGKE